MEMALRNVVSNEPDVDEQNIEKVKQLSLQLVLAKLDDFCDYVSFASTCTYCLTVTRDIMKHLKMVLPVLATQHYDGSVSLWSPFASIPCIKNTRLPTLNYMLIGAGAGMLVFQIFDDLSEMTRTVLFHPVKEVEMELPSLDSLPDIDIDSAKIAVTVEPSGAYLVIILHGKEIDYGRAGDAGWTPVPTIPSEDYDDVILVETSIVAITSKGTVVIWDMTKQGEYAKVVDVGSFFPYIQHDLSTWKFYFSNNSEGKSCSIILREFKNLKTTVFSVLKLTIAEEVAEAETEIGGGTMYLGKSTSITLSRMACPYALSDNIYYVEDRPSAVDFGNFDLANQALNARDELMLAEEYLGSPMWLSLEAEEALMLMFKP